jgi:hypothetical protein
MEHSMLLLLRDRGARRIQSRKGRSDQKGLSSTLHSSQICSTKMRFCTKSYDFGKMCQTQYIEIPIKKMENGVSFSTYADTRAEDSYAAGRSRQRALFDQIAGRIMLSESPSVGHTIRALPTCDIVQRDRMSCASLIGRPLLATQCANIRISLRNAASLQGVPSCR